MQAVLKRSVVEVRTTRGGSFSVPRLLSTAQCQQTWAGSRSKQQRVVLDPRQRALIASGLDTRTQRSFSCTNDRKASAAAQGVKEQAGTVRTASRIPIPIDGKTVEFASILLRDACQCKSCVHESTNQRLFSSADIPANIQARNVELDPTSESVSITWTNDVAGFPQDHATMLDIASLRKLSESGSLPGHRMSPPSQSLWTRRALNLPDYDYNTYMKDDGMLYDVINQLRVDGLAFVTNVPDTEEALATIATRIGPVKDTFYGYTWDVRTVPQANNAAYTSHDLGFHTDLLYFQNPPHIQLLHCIQSASTGGTSVFADAYRAAVDLFHSDPDAFDILATVPVNYHYNHPGANIYRTTKPVIDLRPLRVGDTVYTHIRDYMQARHELSRRNGGPDWTEAQLVDCMDKINWGPPFLAPFSNHDDGVPPGSAAATEPAISTLNRKVEAWHGAAAKFNGLLQRGEYLYERKMKPGECVLFDNTRTLHSRRAFDAQDVGKPRWLRGTYVDKDPYYSKLRVLQNKFGEEKGA